MDLYKNALNKYMAGKTTFPSPYHSLFFKNCNKNLRKWKRTELMWKYSKLSRKKGNSVYVMSTTSFPYRENTFEQHHLRSKLLSVQPGPELLSRLPVKTCTCVLLINILGSRNAMMLAYKSIYDKIYLLCQCIPYHCLRNHSEFLYKLV